MNNYLNFLSPFKFKSQIFIAWLEFKMIQILWKLVCQFFIKLCILTISPSSYTSSTQEN